MEKPPLDTTMNVSEPCRLQESLMELAASGIFSLNVPDRKNAPALILNLSKTGGDLVPVQTGNILRILVNRPEHAEQVFVTQASNFRNEFTHPFAKLDGQYATEGAFLLGLSKRPGLGPTVVDQIAKQIGNSAATGAQELIRRSLSGPVDVLVEMKRILFELTARLLFGVDVSGLSDPFARAISFLEQCWVNEPFSESTPGSGALEAPYFAAWEIRDRTADAIIRASGLRPPEGGTRAQLRNIVIGLLLNGFNATATALTWTIYLLTLHPGPAQRVRAEADEVFGTGEWDARLFRELRYSRLVAMEALRLYPPAWLLGRTAISATSIGQLHIPAGAQLLISPYAMHRHRELWERPDDFDPDRFAESTADGRHRLTYLPFGAGDRRCPAGHLSTGHLQVLCAALLHHCLVERQTNSDSLAPRGLIALRPNPPLMATFAPRATAHRRGALHSRRSGNGAPPEDGFPAGSPKR